MQIEVQEYGDAALLQLVGDLTGGNNNALVQQATALFDKNINKLLLDMSHVAFVGSLGIGDLVRITTQANSMGGRVILAAPTAFVNGVLKTTKLDKFFEI